MPMDRKDVAKIRAHMEYIIENFDVTDFQNELVGKGLTLETTSMVTKEETVKNKNRKCLEYLIKSENGSYQVLIDLLRKRNYTQVLDKLESGLPPDKPTGGADLSKQCIQVPENKRDIRLTDQYLMRFSCTVSPKDKYKLATCLDISHLDVDHIDMNYHDSGTQMMKILLKWKARQGKACTLGVLMEKYNESLGNDVSIDTNKVDKIIADI